MYRARVVNAYPKKSSQWLGRPITMFVYRETPASDAVSFQWKKKTGASPDFVEIDGAKYYEYQIENVSASDKGEYKCTIKFSDGTTQDTNSVEVGDPKDVVDGVDSDKFHSVQMGYRGPYRYTSVRWEVMEKLISIGEDTSLDTHEKFMDKVAQDPELAHIYDLVSRYGYVGFRDSRNGYTYYIDENSKYPGAIVETGKFRNYWDPNNP